MLLSDCPAFAGRPRVWGCVPRPFLALQRWLRLGGLDLRVPFPTWLRHRGSLCADPCREPELPSACLRAELGPEVAGLTYPGFMDTWSRRDWTSATVATMARAQRDLQHTGEAAGGAHRRPSLGPLLGHTSSPALPISMISPEPLFPSPENKEAGTHTHTHTHTHIHTSIYVYT